MLLSQLSLVVHVPSKASCFPITISRSGMSSSVTCFCRPHHIHNSLFYSPFSSWGHRVRRSALQTAFTNLDFVQVLLFFLPELIQISAYSTKSKVLIWYSDISRPCQVWLLASTLSQWPGSECQQTLRERGSLFSKLPARCAGMAGADGQRDSSGAPGLSDGMK